MICRLEKCYLLNFALGLRFLMSLHRSQTDRYNIHLATMLFLLAHLQLIMYVLFCLAFCRVLTRYCTELQVVSIS